MEKNKYKILRKHIPEVKIPSLTGMTWFDSNDNLVPWDEYNTPETGYTVYNLSGGTVSEGYYKWGEPTVLYWNSIDELQAHDDYFIPLYLETTIDDMGVMVGWDGDIQQVEQLCNFSYTGNTGSTLVTVYNTVNSEKLRTIVDQNFTIIWGDGNVSGITSSTFSTLSHNYNPGTYDLSIHLDSSWTKQKLTKKITLPFVNYENIPDPFGIMYFMVNDELLEQQYLNGLDSFTGETEYTDITYVAFGESKLDQKKLYGSTGYTNDVIITTGYTEYVIDDFTYRDYPDGFTMITGNTQGISNIQKEEVPNLCLTRNEHFIGFVDEPTIYSDVFVERGKQGVMEKNLRLSEIDNIGELENYGNGYFNIRKQ